MYHLWQIKKSRKPLKTHKMTDIAYLTSITCVTFEIRERSRTRSLQSRQSKRLVFVNPVNPSDLFSSIPSIQATCFRQSRQPKRLVSSIPSTQATCFRQSRQPKRLVFVNPVNPSDLFRQSRQPKRLVFVNPVNPSDLFSQSRQPKRSRQYQTTLLSSIPPS